MSRIFQKNEKYMFCWWTRIFCIVVALLVVFLHSASAAVINLAWDPSADAAGYKIYCGKVSGTYTKAIDVGNATSHALDLPMGKLYIALTAYDASDNESDFSDEVSWPIQVLSPAPAEVLSSGSSYPVAWYGSSLVSSFNLYYSMNGGVTWILIDDQVTGTRSYNWDLPTPVSNKKNCLLKVVGFDGAGNKLASDSPDGSFTIEVVKLTSPNGGEVFSLGDSHTVTWTTHATKSPVASTEVLLTKDGGATWSIVRSLNDNPGGFNWDVPLVNMSRNQCKLKVVLKDSYNKTVGTDASDAYFTIDPP